MSLKRIISGGQTGADQAGLAAGQYLGLKTGGYMPKGFRTEAGPRPDFENIYGMIEDNSSQYPPRTKKNVILSDATLIFGNINSPGCRLTLRLCIEASRPRFIFLWNSAESWPPILFHKDTKDFFDWINKGEFRTLNVAGNREEKQPGIFNACFQFLITALRAI